MGFKMDVDALKANAKKLKEKAQSGGSVNYFDSSKPEAYVIFLKHENNFIQDLTHHEVWKAKKLVGRVGSPSCEGLDDPISKKGWELYERYKESEVEEVKNLFKKYLPRTESVAFVIDVKDIDKGVQVMRLPKPVKDLLLDEVDGIESEEDAMSIFHPEEARIMKITHNGEKGIKRKYGAVKFLNKKAELISRGKFTEEEIEKQLFDLRKLQGTWDDAKLAKMLALIDDEARYILEKFGGDADDFEATSSDDDDIDTSGSISDDDEDFEIE